jgi:hypothetical protein
MFKYIDDVAKGYKMCFSESSVGCAGGSCYFGFSQPSEKAGAFLASNEKFKEKVAYGNAFYHQIKAEEPRNKYLIKNQYDKYHCPTCGGLRSIHNRKCFKCDEITRLIEK